MAEQIEEKKKTKSGTKKVATGTTKKAVQQRSSSVAGKTKKDKTTSQKKSTTVKQKTNAKKAQTNQVNTKKQTANEKIEQEKKKLSKKRGKETTDVEKKENLQAIQEIIIKERKSNQKLPIEEQNKINGRIFEEILFAIAIMLYFNLIILNSISIKAGLLLIGLKMFDITTLIVGILFLEYAYRRESTQHFAHGIEMIVLAFTTIVLLYVALMFTSKIIAITALISFAFAIYYTAKSMVIYYKMKKQYTIDTMKKMIKKK